jgi:hypothetical protein
MLPFIKSVTFDCSDAVAVARCWAAALGSDVDEDSTSTVLIRCGAPAAEAHLITARGRSSAESISVVAAPASR